jgi:mono/diheme cytochrome c family protein
MRCTLPLTFLLAPTVAALAATDSADVLFIRRIEPLIAEKCVACHGKDREKIKADYDMTTRAGLFRGGESSEAAVIPGTPEKSPLYLSVLRDHADWEPMPPKENDKLTSEQIGWIKQWIAGGAPWPNEAKRKELTAKHADKWSAEDGILVPTSGGLAADWTNRRYKQENLWAYLPVRKPDLEKERKSEGENPIDTLLAAKMPAGLAPAPLADRRTLLRRATFDLLGLPPTPEEVAAFLADPESDERAFAKVVERLLASPHYGEQWGRHWLDVVRYADSSGFANDYTRGNAWRYRDYVIRAFNHDKPYDQFIREQIAGDEMAERMKDEGGRMKKVDADAPHETARSASPLHPSSLFLHPSAPPHPSEALVATGFLRMGPWELTGMEVAKIARQRFLDDVTDITGQVFLGHMLQCARCHDHKFDPLPTRDYYSFQAVFATTQLAERDAPFLPQENTAGFEEQAFLEKRRQEHVAILQQLDEKSLAAAGRWFANKKLDRTAWDNAVANAGTFVKAGGKAGGRTKNFAGAFEVARAALQKQGVPEDQYPPKLLGFAPEDFGMERIARKGLERLKWEFDRYQPVAFAVYDGRTPDVKSINAPTRMPPNPMNAGDLEEVAILTGGDPFSPSQKVAPGALSVVDKYTATYGATVPQAPIPETIEGRRSALAAWIAAPQNPLTARVMVNRIWQWHFGQAIAGNPNNFGATGKKPTHPELLDWLAATFVEKGWSVKDMHRLILSSEAYRRSTQHPDPKTLAEKDPLGTSYAVFKPRRLTAEELRDTMLQVTGELNPTLGGIPARPEINLEAALQPRQVMGTFAEAWQPDPRPEQRHRRSIYASKIRGQLDPFMEVFNAPSPDLSCEARDASTVTPQVFSMFNSEASLERALAFAARLRKESGGRGQEPAIIKRAFQLSYGRAPRPEEERATVAHWTAMTARHQTLTFPQKSPPKEVVREAVEENTGEKFRFAEKLAVYESFVPDLQPSDTDAETRGLAEVCLILFNSNEFAYVY